MPLSRTKKKIIYLPWPSNDLLDLIRLQQTRQICACHDRLRQVVVALQFRLLAPGTIQGIQALESRFRPDAETTNMATRSKLHEVKFVDGDQRNAWDVAEGLSQTLVLSIDDQRAQLAGTAAVTHLAFTSTETPCLVNLK